MTYIYTFCLVCTYCMNRYMYLYTIYFFKILSGWKLFICYYMLQLFRGKVKVFKYTKHIAIKKYTSEQNLIKTPKHLQNIRKKKTNYIFLLLNSIKNAKPYVTNQVYKSKSISCISFALL